MRLLEAIVDANHRADAGDAGAGLQPSRYADALPLIALTCIDPRLNPLLPEVLGIPEESFIWLRNAGNIITGPLSSTMRSLALACAIKGGREIAIIGHTDCQVCRTSVLQFTERLKQLGVDRARLPENLIEYFGLSGSERQNVIKSVDFVRSSPLIGPAVPVHGLVVDIATGRLDWLVNGYTTLGSPAAAAAGVELGSGPLALDQFKQWVPFEMGEMKFPEGRIGEAATQAEGLLHKVQEAAAEAGRLAANAGSIAEKIGEKAAAAAHWITEAQAVPTGKNQPRHITIATKGTPAKPPPLHGAKPDHGSVPIPPPRRPPLTPRREN